MSESRTKVSDPATSAVAQVLEVEPTHHIEPKPLEKLVEQHSIEPVQEPVPRADKTMIFALVCAAAFSICLVVFVLFPVMQTLVSASSSSWNPGP